MGIIIGALVGIVIAKFQHGPRSSCPKKWLKCEFTYIFIVLFVILGVFTQLIIQSQLN